MSGTQENSTSAEFDSEMNQIDLRNVILGMMENGVKLDRATNGGKRDSLMVSQPDWNSIYSDMGKNYENRSCDGSSIFADESALNPEMRQFIWNSVTSTRENDFNMDSELMPSSADWDAIYAEINRSFGNYSITGNINNIEPYPIDVGSNPYNTYGLATQGFVWSVVSSVSGDMGDSVQSVNGIKPDSHRNVDVFRIVSKDYSGNYNYVDADLNVLSGGIEYRLLTNKDLDGLSSGVYTSVGELSGKIDCISNLSGDWQNSYLSVESESANWESVYTTVNSLSSEWETVSEKVSSVSISSTDEEYPSAKCLYDSIKDFANRVENPLSGDFALVDSIGNLFDSRLSPSDFVRSSDIRYKMFDAGNWSFYGLPHGTTVSVSESEGSWFFSVNGADYPATSSDEGRVLTGSITVLENEYDITSTRYILHDRSVNFMSISSDQFIEIPQSSEDGARDFLLRLTLSSTSGGTVPVPYFDTVADYETEDGKWPDFSKNGTYIVRLTETLPSIGNSNATFLLQSGYVSQASNPASLIWGST